MKMIKHLTREIVTSKVFVLGCKEGRIKMKLLKPTHEYSGEIMEYKHAFYNQENNHMAVVLYKILILSMNGLKK